MQEKKRRIEPCIAWRLKEGCVDIGEIGNLVSETTNQFDPLKGFT